MTILKVCIPDDGKHKSVEGTDTLAFGYRLEIKNSILDNITFYNIPIKYTVTGVTNDTHVCSVSSIDKVDTTMDVEDTVEQLYLTLLVGANSVTSIRISIDMLIDEVIDFSINRNKETGNKADIIRLMKGYMSESHSASTIKLLGWEDIVV